MRRQPPERVLVTCDKALVAEAIGAALASRGYLVVRRPWSGEPDQTSHGRATEHGAPPDVALLLCDLDRPPRLRRALTILRERPAPWLVLTAATKGPVWGGLLEAGARLVGPSSTTLDELEQLLALVAAGAGVPGGERRQLVADWHRLAMQQVDLVERITMMTPRELEVLGLLYAGTPVRSIARQLTLSESTVRSLVQRVLRKLGVRTQLAAVAALATAAHPVDEVIASLVARRGDGSPKSGKARDSPRSGRAAASGMGASRRTGEQG